MTEKEKAKAYDEAIERAKKWHNIPNPLYCNIITEKIFPELKESEDEKIRKEIISILRNAYWTSNKNRFNELVAWLEKQGKNSTDKIEPKFKVGDKIVNISMKYWGAPVTQGTISKITKDKYIFSDSSYMSISNQDSWELVSDKKPKFDPKTLQPFDKVLIRRGSENYNVWFPDFVSEPPNDTNNNTLCMCVGEDISMVIPYNNNTKHLVGTTDEAPEYYKYWED